jgi:hypothetical protein
MTFTRATLGMSGFQHGIGMRTGFSRTPPVIINFRIALNGEIYP